MSDQSPGEAQRRTTALPPTDRRTLLKVAGAAGAVLTFSSAAGAAPARAALTRRRAYVLVIDGSIHVGAFLAEITGDLGRLTTTGNVRNYGLFFFAGLVALLVWMVF